MDLRPGRTALDLGAGTGKMARMLTPTGAHLIAIEPVAAMRAILGTRARGASVIGAVAEALPIAEGAVDAAIAAHAFHWFDGRRALSELTRVIYAGGSLALVWNVRDETTPWVHALTDLIEPYRGDTPSYRSMRWKEAFADSSSWGEPELSSFAYEHLTSRAGALDRVLSISFIAALPPSEREMVTRRLDAILPEWDMFVFPYRTDVWLSRRRP